MTNMSWYWLRQTWSLPQPTDNSQPVTAGYQLWDSIQGLSSYARGMLSSQAMLAGVGVGSATATPLSAVFQFFIKDFSGMLGGILFAASQGAGLDAHAKQWRLLADVMNDIGGLP